MSTRLFTTESTVGHCFFLWRERFPEGDVDVDGDGEVVLVAGDDLDVEGEALSFLILP